MTHMLDTNTVSHLLRDRTGKVASKLNEVGLKNIGISAIVFGELEFGIALKGSNRLRDAVDWFVGNVQVFDLGPSASEAYGRIRAEMKKSGRTIGPNDLWIAAHALALDAVLVTDNEREFSRVPGLTIQNWLRDAG